MSHQQFGIQYKSPTNGKELTLGAWPTAHEATAAAKSALDLKKVTAFNIVVRDVSDWREV